MKAYTDIEQSKILMKILPPETADMAWCNNSIRSVNYTDEYETFNKAYRGWDKYWELIPCWSLAALMNILDRGALFITPQGWVCQSYINFKAITSDYHSNPIDACYEIILRLRELKML